MKPDSRDFVPKLAAPQIGFSFLEQLDAGASQENTRRFRFACVCLCGYVLLFGIVRIVEIALEVPVLVGGVEVDYLSPMERTTSGKIPLPGRQSTPLVLNTGDGTRMVQPNWKLPEKTESPTVFEPPVVSPEVLNSPPGTSPNPAQKVAQGIDLGKIGGEPVHPGNSSVYDGSLNVAFDEKGDSPAPSRPGAPGPASPNGQPNPNVGPQSVSELFLRSSAIDRVAPAYPPIAKESGITGVIVVEMVVGTNGRVESAKVISGSPIFHAASLDAAKRWKFRPPQYNGMNCKFIGRLTFRFVLE
ncbi:MAG: TonB family protein [Acidobacteria bacterium]|nr:TonB family protein [Acidobacteriota bacterium]